MRLLICFLLLNISALSAAEKYKSIVPLSRAHAHNDYEHAHPLFDALEHGFCSVEADIFLVNGELLVAHKANETKPERTLDKLYLAPLFERVQKNKRVFANTESFTLLIDFKVDEKNVDHDPQKFRLEVERLYVALGKLLKKYKPMLTQFYDDRIETNAVTVILTGSRPQNLLLHEKEPRLAALDGKIADLDSSISKNFMPLISDKWSNFFTWKGRGPMPENEKQKLKEFVTKAHAQGRRIRFWDTPDRLAAPLEIWSQLLHSDVDLINTDHLAELETFLTH